MGYNRKGQIDLAFSRMLGKPGQIYLRWMAERAQLNVKLQVVFLN